MKASTTGAFLTMLILVMAVADASGISYIVTDLGTLGGSDSDAAAINNSGQIVGDFSLDSFQRHAFLYSGGVMQDLGTLGGQYSQARDINDSGQVVGSSQLSTGDTHAFLYSDGVMQDLGAHLGEFSVAISINNSGNVVGGSDGYPFIYSGGTMQILGGGEYSGVAYAINESGQVSGLYYSSYGISSPFLFSNGNIQNLGSLGGSSGTALGINNSGQVAGMSYTMGDIGHHAFLYHNGVMVDLGTLGGIHSTGNGINNSGQVVGASLVIGETLPHAFLYSGDSMLDLNDFISDPSWILSVARDINDFGQIVGRGLHNGEQRAFLLTPDSNIAPIPEPSTFVLVGLGFVGMGFLRRNFNVRLIVFPRSGYCVLCLIQIVYILIIALCCVSFAGNSDSNKNGKVDEKCKTANDLIEAGEYKKAVDISYDILTDKKLLNGENLDCARTALIDATIKQRKEADEKKTQLCEKASSQLKKGLPSSADKLYKEVLKVDNINESQIVCATEGLSEVAKYYVKAGNKFKTDGDFVAAETAYNSAINSKEDFWEAHQELAKLRREKAVNQIKSLNNLGLEDDAFDKFKTTLETDPTISRYEAIIAYTKKPKIPFWKELREIEISRFGSLTNQLPDSIEKMVIIEAFILLVFIWLFGRKFLWGKPYLEVKKFIVNGNEAEVAYEFSSELEHCLMDLSITSRARSGVLMVSGPITPLSIDISSILPSAKWFEPFKGVLNFLIARPTLAVSGCIYLEKKEETKKGEKENYTGVSVCLEHSNRILMKHTISKKDFAINDTKFIEDREDLAKCAAIWAAFALQQTPIRLFSKIWMRLRQITGKQPTILGTWSWESYAWFLMGDKKWNSNDPQNSKAAEIAYIKALNLDPEFAASTVNLAGIYHMLGKEEGPGLEVALEQLNCIKPTFLEKYLWSAEPSFYVGYFCRAVISFDLSEDQGQKLDDAIRYINEVLKHMNRAKSIGIFNNNLKSYINTRIPIANCIRLGMEVKKIGNKDIEDVSMKKIKNNLETITNILSPRNDFSSLYNLACTYSLFSSSKKFDEIYHRTKCLGYLKRCLQISKYEHSPGIVKLRAQRARRDVAFKHLLEDKDFNEIIDKAIGNLAA